MLSSILNMWYNVMKIDMNVVNYITKGLIIFF